VQTLRLLVPSPALPDRLDRFIVANVAELSRRQVKGLIDAEQVRVDNRLERRAGRKLKCGEVVELNYRPSWRASGQRTTLDIIKDGNGWILINKPSGTSSHPNSDDDESSINTILAESSLPNAEELSAVHRLDRGTSGLLLLARSHARPQLSGLFEDRLIKKEYLAVVHPAPQKQSGKLEGPSIDGKTTHLKWQLKRRSKDGTRAELLVQPHEGRTHQVRVQLSAAGWPLLGDMEHGRPVPGGAPRLALHCRRMQCDLFDAHCPPPEGWDELLEPQPDHASPLQSTHNKDHKKQTRDSKTKRVPGRMRKGVNQLQVSRSSARILRNGHPWLIQDRWTGDFSNFAPGDPAYLVDERGEYVATAITDPGQELCARVVSMDPQEAVGKELFGSRAAVAAHARRGLLNDSECTAIRIVHGEADGLPGLSIDLWGDVLVSTLSSAALREMAQAAYDGLRDAFGDLPLFEREHFVDLRNRAQGDAKLPGEWVWKTSDTVPSSVWVLESGLRYLAQPLDGLSTGLYPDQRSNRSLLSGLVANSEAAEVANLFSHTGAFSVACAAAGARQVWSVDLSKPYSEIARRNLEENGLSPKEHPIVVDHAMEWLKRGDSQFDGMILDPPSRASGKKASKKGWSSRQDYQRLVALAARRLRPGGWMLCCSNLRGVPNGWLGRQVTAGLRDAGRRANRTQKAPPSPDFPTIPGFPEGRPFHATLVHLDD